MAEKNRVVGIGDCTISSLVQKLSSSGSFHLLFDKWQDVAYSLGVSQVVIKKRQLDFLLNKDSLKHVVVEILESWVGEKGDEAYLEDLLKALKENGMEALAGLLRGEPEYVSKQPKKYCRFPQSLKKFFSSQNKNYTIITTLDTSITCQKIRENCKNSKILEVKGFFTEASKDLDATTDMRSPYVITVIKLDDVEKVSKATTAFPVEKLLIITGEPEEKLNEFKGTFKIVKDEMEWDDLSPIFQFEIEERLQQQIGMNIQNLSETVLGQVLVDLINKVEVKLFENTIPEELLVSYYIPRVIIERTSLDQDKLFRDDSIDDIFLFTGINKPTLRGYVRTGMTGISSELLHSKVRRDLRFIVMQNPTHFPVICCNNPNKSVHFIKLEDEEFHWVKTSGDMKNIQKLIKIKPLEELSDSEEDTDEDTEEDTDEEEDDNEKFREAELVANVVLNKDARVVCLSDTPGMGKSVLLAKIGEQLKDSPDSNKIVIFLPLPDVTKSMKRLDNKNLEIKNLESALHDLACQNNLEKEIISKKLTSAALEIELLLDGFDEVELERIDLAFKLLQFIKEFNSIRLWVGTRPQHLEKLEQKLNTIGYNIKPFNKMEQIRFLNKFWINRNQDLDKNLLNDFAHIVLETLFSTTARGTRESAKEVEIAGIPLQCHMLAHIYEKNAVLLCGHNKNENTTEDIPILLDIKSITDLYKALVEHKFQKYQKTYSGQDKLDTHNLYSMHSKVALQLIFPDWFDKNLAYLFQEDVNINELLNVGLLEGKNISSSNQFIHRTFAEYFCAYFVAEMLLKDVFKNEAFISFFYKGFLSNFKDIVIENPLCYWKVSFHNIVLCSFLNSLIHTLKSSSTKVIFTNNSSNNPPTVRLPTKDILPDEIQTFIVACSKYNFQSLFNLFTEHPNFEKNVSDIIDEKLLLDSIKNHCFEMYKIIHDHFKKHSKFSARLSFLALKQAIVSADTSKLEYFLNVEGLFDKVLGNPQLKLNILFYFYFDINLMYYAIKPNSIDMVNLLVEFEKRVYETHKLDYNSLNFQKEKTYWRSALLSQNDLDYKHRVELIRLGADIFQTDAKGNNFLHIKPQTNEGFLQYFKALAKYPSKEIKLLIQTKNYIGLTPLACAFKNKVQFSRECMKMWKEAGADFTEVFTNIPLFVYALQSGNASEVLQFMIENGVDLYWRKEQIWKGERKIKTYLDYAAEAGNLKAIQFLVREHGMDVNGINEYSHSPLDFLIQHWNKHYSQIFLHSAPELWKLGGRFKSTAPDHLRRIVFERKDINLLKFGLDACLEINKKDEDGNTLLHQMINEWCGDDQIEMVLEAGANLSAKNKKGFTPLDLALSSNKDIVIVRLLKPSKDFKWSSVSPMVNLDVFRRILCQSANNISDKNEFLSLLEEFIQRSSSENINVCLNNLFRNGSLLSPVQFNLITEYSLKNRDLLKLWTTFGNNDGCTALHHAVKNIKGIEEKTLKILQKNVDFKLKDEEGKSLLFYAVEGGQTPEFLEILSGFGGGDFQDKDKNGQNLLHALAAGLDSQQNTLKMTEFLIKKRVDRKCVDLDGNTQLHCCFKDHEGKFKYQGLEVDRRVEFIKAMLKCGAKPEIKDKKGETFLDLACITTKDPYVQAILKVVLDYGHELSCIFANISLDDVVKHVFSASTTEQFIYFTNKIIELKNKKMADWGEDYFPFKQWQNNLLSSNFHLVVENLIENGQAQTFFSLAENGMRALHHVVSRFTMKERTLKLLQENGINLGVKEENGWSLLFHAINRYRTTLKELKLLEEYGGGNMREKDKSGKNLLHVAVNAIDRYNSNSNIVESLLEKVGLDPNEVDNEGNTPLHILLQNWNKINDRFNTILFVQTFIEVGANIFIENSEGETVASLAEKIHDKERKNDPSKTFGKEFLLSILYDSKNHSS